MTFARVRALIFVAVLFITAGVVVIMAIARDTQTQPIGSTDCPAGLIPARIRMPERFEVTLNLYNGTRRAGLAEQIADEFRGLRFKVKKTGTARGNKVYENEVAVINYGPQAVGAAHLVSAYFLAQATMNFDIKRKDAIVDVILGTEFQQLATTTEVNQSIAAIGTPDLPEGTCQAVDDTPPPNVTPTPSVSPNPTKRPTTKATPTKAP